MGRMGGEEKPTALAREMLLPAACMQEPVLEQVIQLQNH